MQEFYWPNCGIETFPILYGAMQLGGAWDKSPIDQETRKKAFAAIESAREHGIDLYDHADIYCQGKSEEVFGEYLKEHHSVRDEIVVQSKCGIIPFDEGPVRYDFSYEHIVSSVEGSLKRLQCGYLDVLLLHRPDPLVEPEEVAEAFHHLRRTGKVRHFGVSNHSPAQMDLLSTWVDESIVTNQLELSLAHPDLVAAGTAVNQREPEIHMRDEGTVEYCRAHGITVQAWSPVAKGIYSGNLPKDASDATKRCAELVASKAKERGVSAEAIVLAWLLRHPAPILPVIGTTNPDRISNSAQAIEVELSRSEWYELLEAARGMSMP